MCGENPLGKTSIVSSPTKKSLGSIRDREITKVCVAHGRKKTKNTSKYANANKKSVEKPKGSMCRVSEKNVGDPLGGGGGRRPSEKQIYIPHKKKKKQGSQTAKRGGKQKKG